MAILSQLPVKCPAWAWPGSYARIIIQPGGRMVRGVPVCRACCMCPPGPAGALARGAHGRARRAPPPEPHMSLPCFYSTKGPSGAASLVAHRGTDPAASSPLHGLALQEAPLAAAPRLARPPGLHHTVRGHPVSAEERAVARRAQRRAAVDADSVAARCVQLLLAALAAHARVVHAIAHRAGGPPAAVRAAAVRAAVTQPAAFAEGADAERAPPVVPRLAASAAAAGGRAVDGAEGRLPAPKLSAAAPAAAGIRCGRHAPRPPASEANVVVTAAAGRCGGAAEAAGDVVVEHDVQLVAFADLSQQSRPARAGAGELWARGACPRQGALGPRPRIGRANSSARDRDEAGPPAWRPRPARPACVRARRPPSSAHAPHRHRRTRALACSGSDARGRDTRPIGAARGPRAAGRRRAAPARRSAKAAAPPASPRRRRADRRLAGPAGGGGGKVRVECRESHSPLMRRAATEMRTDGSALRCGPARTQASEARASSSFKAAHSPCSSVRP